MLLPLTRIDLNWEYCPASSDTKLRDDLAARQVFQSEFLMNVLILTALQTATSPNPGV